MKLKFETYKVRETQTKHFMFFLFVPFRKNAIVNYSFAIKSKV